MVFAVLRCKYSASQAVQHRCEFAQGGLVYLPPLVCCWLLVVHPNHVSDELAG
jgi:hypothetical protein